MDVWRWYLYCGNTCNGEAHGAYNAARKKEAYEKKIEAEYNRCLQKAETNLAKELCSFGPRVATDGEDSKIPQKKTIQDRIVNKVEYQRRECTDDQELRSFECIELDVARDATVRRTADDKEMPIKSFQQFRY